MSRTFSFLVILFAMSRFAQAQTISVSTDLSHRFAAYDFTMDKRPAADQVKLLSDLGYAGLVPNLWGGDPLARVRKFEEVPAVKSGAFHIYALLWTPNVTDKIDPKFLDDALTVCAELHADFWVIVGGPKSKVDEAVTLLKVVADHAKVHNVQLVLYPHDGTTFVDAEEALEVLRKMQKPGVKLSIHLCHELKAGNANRLAEIIAKVDQYIALASINGVDSTVDYHKPGWDTTIMPLDKGNYDVLPYVKALLEHGYSGPFIQHTFGLKTPPEEHLAGSIEAWRKICAKVGFVRRNISRRLVDPPDPN